MPDYCLYLGAGDVVFVQDHTLFKFVVGNEHFYDIQVHILYRRLYSQDP